MTKRLTITVPGIRTFGQWQERVRRLVKHADRSVQPENYHYRYFSVIAFALPFLRWRATRPFRKQLLRAIAEYPEHHIYAAGERSWQAYKRYISATQNHWRDSDVSPNSLWGPPVEWSASPRHSPVSGQAEVCRTGSRRR